MHFLPRQTDIIGENVSLNEACELHICLYVTNQTEIWKCRYLRSEKKKNAQSREENESIQAKGVAPGTLALGHMGRRVSEL